MDVLVCTPGRLTDHLDRTPGFTLQHLRFLIIDEADRLVGQSYQGWIGRVTDLARFADCAPPGKTAEGGDKIRGKSGAVVDPVTWRRSAMTSVCRPVPLRKLLFSATLTRDPQKLAALGLTNPKRFDAHHLIAPSPGIGPGRRKVYSVPDGLSEFRIVCAAEQKPLVLLALLLDAMGGGGAADVEGEIESGGDGWGGRIAVVFTASVDSTHRLARLLQLLWVRGGYGPPWAVAEFSSALNQKQRSRLLKRCRDSSGGVSVVICSDGMSRGMDLPDVSAVINYDVPRFAKTYVHRCGRTARAGREGRAVSVLEGGQVRDFGRMRKLIEDPGRVREMGVNKQLAARAIPVYAECVSALRDVIEAESQGGLDTVAPLTGEWLSEQMHGS